MAIATRVRVPECFTVLERRESPPCRGPSSVRIRCALSREYSSRRLGGGGRTVTDRRDRDPVTDEQTFFVYDPSTFHRYEDMRRAFQGMLASMSLLQGVDIASDNWLNHSALERVPASMHQWTLEDDDTGLIGCHYHFYVVVAMEVNLVHSEPKAVVRACAETFMQTVQMGSADQCSICMEDFSFGSGGGDAMSPVNLPCSHPFHNRCITMWLFKGHTCPVCRHDLAGLVSAPWASDEHTLAKKN